MKFLIVLSLTALVCCVSGDLRQDLLTRATALEKESEELIKRLEAEGRLVDVAIIEREDLRLRRLAAELRLSVGPIETRIIETQISVLENIIREQLNRLEGRSGRPTSARPATTPQPRPSTARPSTARPSTPARPSTARPATTRAA